MLLTQFLLNEGTVLLGGVLPNSKSSIFHYYFVAGEVAAITLTLGITFRLDVVFCLVNEIRCFFQVWFDYFVGEFSE